MVGEFVVSLGRKGDEEDDAAGDVDWYEVAGRCDDKWDNNENIS